MFQKGKMAPLLRLATGLLLMACAKSPQDTVKNKFEDSRVDAQLIYGEDNRLENYQASSAMQNLAASTVALVQEAKLSSNSQGQISLGASPFGDSHRLCSTEPFREQSAGAFCSGSLVGPDIVITAGHCVTDASSCASTRFVFDYALKAPGQEKKIFSKSDVYACKEIIHREQQSSGYDYAIIRLDRKVVGRSPLNFRRQGVVQAGEPVVVIGHPAGLPQKIAGGAQVRSVQAGFFVTNLDTYGGNSGSAVFNPSTGLIEGILVRGDMDFVSQGSCFVSNKCADSECRGEDVTRIDQLSAELTKLLAGQDPPLGPVGGDQVFTAAPKLAIPDSPRAGVASVLNVDLTPQGRLVQVQVNVSHSYRGDLVLELQAPDGKKVTLQNRSGGSLHDVVGTFGGDLVSAQSLTLLSQVTKSGPWTLRVTDKAAVDIGVLNSWSLIFKK